MRRVLTARGVRALTALAVAAPYSITLTSSAVNISRCFQTGGAYPPGGVPPELRAPPGAEAASMGQPPAMEEDFQPPQKPTEAPKYFTINTNEKGIAHIQLARPPVNALSLEVLQELNQWLLWMGSSEECNAIVFSSASPTVFSSGMDLAELHNPNPSRFTTFWQAFQETWLIFNSFPKPIIAAITGNAPAGGCVLAMGCDFRVMARAPKGAEPNTRLYRIGLNEVKLGIMAPAWAMPAYSYLMGSRTAERMLQLGETPVADEAQKLGLVDLVAKDEEEAVTLAFQQAERFLAVPQQSRWMSRDMMRREYLQMLASNEDRTYDSDFVTQMISSPEVQKNLGSYLDRLKGKLRK